MSSGSGTGVSFCFVTAPSKEVANKLADAIVKEKLAACVNVIPGLHPRQKKSSLKEFTGKSEGLERVGVILRSKNDTLVADAQA